MENEKRSADKKSRNGVQQNLKSKCSYFYGVTCCPAGSGTIFFIVSRRGSQLYLSSCKTNSKLKKSKGANAWTAKTSDFDQRLIVDLGQVMNVTRIATRGRPHSSEYVMEYSVSYGTNGLDYTDYKEPGGSIRVRAFTTSPPSPAVNALSCMFLFYPYNAFTARLGGFTHTIVALCCFACNYICVLIVYFSCSDVCRFFSLLRCVLF